MSDGPSIFARYIEDDGPKKESPTEPEIVRRGPQPIIPPTYSKSSPSEKLLAWLVNYWGKPTITLRDIYSYGPNCARDPADRDQPDRDLDRIWVARAGRGVATRHEEMADCPRAG